MIYFDAHSATAPCSASLERMKPYLEEYWGASFSPHRKGQELIASLDTRLQQIYDFAGALPEDSFVFTSSGAEAVNQVLWSVFLEVSRKEGKCHFIASSLEDAPTMQMLKRLEELGCTVKIVPANEKGQIDLEKLKEMISPRTALVSLTMAQGLTGVIQPIEEVAALCKEKKVLFHLEAAYAVGKMGISFADLGADYLTFSGDRIHALKGSGALFAKEKSPLVPLILGGTEQGGLRGGALDIPSLMAFSAACSQASLYLDAMNLETARLRDLFESEMEKMGAKPLYREGLRLPNTSVISFPKAHQEALLYILNRKGVYASIGGFFCQHLHRLTNDESTVSFTFSRSTTEEEIVKGSAIIREAYNQLKTVSEGIC